MVTKQRIHSYLRTGINHDVLDVLDDAAMDEIIRNSLTFYGLFYPKVVEDIIIQQSDVLQKKNKFTGQPEYGWYRVPKEDEEVEYISLAYFDIPGNMAGNRHGLNNTSSMMGRVSTATHGYIGMIRTVSFMAPDILRVSPDYEDSHEDFAVTMNRLPFLHEVKPSMMLYFMDVVTAYAKLFIVHKYRNGVEDGNFGGVDMVSMLSDYQSDATSSINDLRELFRVESHKEPERLRELFAAAQTYL